MPSDMMWENFYASFNFIFSTDCRKICYFCRWDRYSLLSLLAKCCCASRQPTAIVPRRTASPISYASGHATPCSRRSSVSAAAAQTKHGVIRRRERTVRVNTAPRRSKIQQSTTRTVAHISINLYWYKVVDREKSIAQAVAYAVPQ